MPSFNHSKILGIGAMFISLATISCKKFVAIDAPRTSVNEENVYITDATAIAVLTGVFSRMVNDGGFDGVNGISLRSGLSADELTLVNVVTDNRQIAYYRNQLRVSPSESYGAELWGGGGANLYYYIFICNAAIEGINNSEALTPAVKKQLLGEAKFARAFFYFYLAAFFGDVPLALTTNPAVNASLSRSPLPLVYQQIITDLKEAQKSLNDNYLNKDLQNYIGTPERVRPTQWAAIALLARTYLYMGDYSNAETEAGKIIGNTNRFSLTDINSVFLKNSMEAIWQLQPLRTTRNTEDAFTFILPVTGPNANLNPVYLSPQLLNVFEGGDLRRKGGGWVDSVIVAGTTYYYPAKYKATTTSGAVTEYLMVFRLAEQYLIRAEARVHQNNFSGAQEDLNKIRIRAGLPETKANDKTSLLTAVLKERQIELLTEWGHRWLDLKRTGNIDVVMSGITPLKANGAQWQSYQQYYPVNYDDLLKDPNLTQNKGY